MSPSYRKVFGSCENELPQKCSQQSFSLKKRIKAAVESKVVSRYFYNSDCKNIEKIHENLVMRKKSCEHYVLDKGFAKVLIKHKKVKVKLL